MSQSSLARIHVGLLDEGIDVWVPVEARLLTDGSYEIVSSNPNPCDQHWEFGTGAIVNCRLHKNS